MKHLVELKTMVVTEEKSEQTGNFSSHLSCYTIKTYLITRKKQHKLKTNATLLSLVWGKYSKLNINFIRDLNKSNAIITMGR